LHHDEFAPVLGPDLVNRADMRMFESGRGASLAQKAFGRIFIVE
jgi:hypothetical protein